MLDNHAVYEHIRTDTGEVFYVGLGGPDRLRSVTRRHNKYHSRIYNKMKRMGLTVEQRIIADRLPKESAETLEKMRIAMWRAAGVALVNMTAGGEGLNSPSHEVRERIGAAKRGTKHSAEALKKMRIAQNAPDVIARKVAAHLGKPVSAETRAKIAAVQNTP